MCQTTNCCVACCAPAGRAAWVFWVVVLAVVGALVCVWAYVAVQVDALVLLRTARIPAADVPLVVASWWSPTARHLLAAKVAARAVVLTAGPGAIQATMAALAALPVAVLGWVRAGCPVPIWVRQRTRPALRAVVAAVVGRRSPQLPASMTGSVRPALPASERRRVTLRRAAPTSGVQQPSIPPPARAALPAPALTPGTGMRFIRLADRDRLRDRAAVPMPTPPDTRPGTSITAKTAKPR